MTTRTTAAAALGLPVETLLGLYRDMWRIRRFEETALYHSSQGDVYGTLHLYIGEEATAVGVCSVLRRDDYVASTHRGHGHCVAKGARMDRMMAELFGRATGYCRGKGGSMHIADFSCGMLGANGIVGASLGLAAGAALMAQVRGSGQIAVAFFGDGASTRGTFHEVLNLSSLWKLPVLFVCENNGYAQWMAQKENLAADHVVDMAGSYKLPGVSVDGNDVLAVHAAARAAAERARQGGGPSLLECRTYRIHGHSLGDLQVYRDKTEVEEWKRRDPIARLEARLRETGVLDDAGRQRILDGVEAEVAQAVTFAAGSPFPEAADLLTDVTA
jgi:TPP-dependent pyruvate/acetoin dehydrogenase alpha subunit